MNIIFFGSSKFAVPPLKSLIASGENILCVVTQPDRQKGRGFHVEGTEVKNLAQELGFKIFQPDQVNTQESLDFLKSLKADLFVVISYGQILSRDILNVPGIFSINAHGSLLPKYRGAAPIQRAIIAGEKMTGVTIIKMSDKMDAGEIIEQGCVEIAPADNSLTVFDKLSGVAAELLVKAIAEIKSNNYQLREQNESEVTFAAKLKKIEGEIDWGKSANQINDLVRGCLGWPGAYTFYKGKPLKILLVEPLDEHEGMAKPGQVAVVSKSGIVVSCGKGSLRILEVQPEAGRVMSAAEFLAGHKIVAGETLGK